MTFVSRNNKIVPHSANRQLLRVECRSVPVLSGNKLGGYAAVFGPVADLGDHGLERMAAGCFARALQTSDTRALYQHDPALVLGRQSSGTLRLATDDHGLEYEVDLPDTTYARDLRELVERGDITGASFQFVPDRFDFDRAEGVTTHTDVATLVDVSPVTFPAYEGASTEARSQQLGATRRRSQLIRARARVHLER